MLNGPIHMRWKLPQKLWAHSHILAASMVKIMDPFKFSGSFYLINNGPTHKHLMGQSTCIGSCHKNYGPIQIQRQHLLLGGRHSVPTRSDRSLTLCGLGLPRFSSEPRSEPELFWTGPWSSPWFSICPRTGPQSSLGFRPNMDLSEPVWTRSDRRTAVWSARACSMSYYTFSKKIQFPPFRFFSYSKSLSPPVCLFTPLPPSFSSATVVVWITLECMQVKAAPITMCPPCVFHLSFHPADDCLLAHLKIVA
jgi:hypothetical protein